MEDELAGGALHRGSARGAVDTAVRVVGRRSRSAALLPPTASRHDRSGATLDDIETIDTLRALDLLREAVRRHGGLTTRAAHGGIVAAALRCAGVGESDLGLLDQHDVRTLWVHGRLPCPMTLGAVAVLGRAQKAELVGASWSGAARHAARATRVRVPAHLCGSQGAAR